MRNRLLCLLLPCFFLFGNVSAGIETLRLDGGTEAAVVVGKTGSKVFIFHIPKKYFYKKNLILPLEVSITNAGKRPVYEESNNDLIVRVPELRGAFLITLEVGDFRASKFVIL